MAASTSSTRKRTRKKKRFQTLRRVAKRVQAWALARTINGAARPTVRFERGGAAAHLTIRGSANHSLLVAARNIHLQAPFVLVPVTFIALIALVTFGVAITNAVGSPASSKPMFTAGQRYALDIAVLPFQPTSADSTCRDMAGDLASEVALRMSDSLRPNALSGDMASTVRVWSPDQVPMGNLAGAGSPGEQANRLVVERGADVVLYGTVDCTGDNITVTPGFVVAPAYIQYAPDCTAVMRWVRFPTPSANASTTWLWQRSRARLPAGRAPWPC